MTDTIRTHTDQAGFLTLKPEPWAQEAACAATDPDMFFPEPGGSPEAAKRVCRSCPVIDECADYAIRTKQSTGIWGGRAPRQLRVLAERRKT